jgi:hypothetical protein
MAAPTYIFRNKKAPYGALNLSKNEFSIYFHYNYFYY